VILFGSGIALDSVDALELVVALDARFGIRVDENEFRTTLRTVNALVDLVVAARSAKVPS
jgi:acyl carrier protein